jgi:hypothetical protein
MKMSLTIDIEAVDQKGIQTLLTLVLAIERLAKTLRPEVRD